MKTKAERFLKRPNAAIPFGVVVSHGDCSCLVRWDDGSARLKSLVPLVLDGEVTCTSCGVTL